MSMTCENPYNFLETITDWCSLTLYLHSKICSKCKMKYAFCAKCPQALKINELVRKERRKF